MRPLFFATLLITAPFANAEIVDMRSAEYRKGTEHLAQANQALNRAISELKRAEAAYGFPGLDVVRMLGQIQEVNETLRLILTPENRRLKYQTLVPDTTFFKPIARKGE